MTGLFCTAVFYCKKQEMTMRKRNYINVIGFIKYKPKG